MFSQRQSSNNKAVELDDSYIINHLGEERENYQGAIAPPVYQTSNFCFPNVESMRENIHREFEVPFYSRGNNPTLAVLRKKIAALERTEDALITASGCAAISTAVLSVVKAGDHVLFVNNCYSWANTLFTVLLRKFGVESTSASGCNTEDFLKNVRPNTSLIYLESPTSFTFELQDIEAITRFAKSKGITTIIDNSYSTPLFQKPATLGVDIVVHSASKFIGGHSDVVAGIICSSQDRIRKMFNSEYLTLGGIASPQTAWLLLRGLRTLPLRLKRSMENGLAVARFLERHPKVLKVIHPGLESHPQHKLAMQQLTGYSGLFSFQLKTESIEKIDAFCNTLKHFLLACSWGGHESLIFPASALYSSQNNKQTIPLNLVRIYTGLEDTNFLIDDLENALKKI